MCYVSKDNNRFFSLSPLFSFPIIACVVYIKSYYCADDEASTILTYCPLKNVVAADTFINSLMIGEMDSV